MNDAIVWRPDAASVADANVSRFMAAHGVADYDDLVRRAGEDPDWYWSALIADLGLVFETPYAQVRDLSRGAPWARWCVGGRMNVTQTCLDRHRGTPVAARPAIAWEGEDGSRRDWDYARLDRETCRLAGGLATLGYGPGDAIGLYMPMCPEVVAAFLAIARIGAVCVPLFSGFGPGAIVTRLQDAGATGVITVQSTQRRGRPVAMKETLDEALEELPAVSHVVVLGDAAACTQARDRDWAALVADQPDDRPATIVDADAPLLLVYTSGTTGKPKGSILTHCGFATKIGCDFTHCLDLKGGDRLMWMSDFGWVVGPATAMAATLTGACLVLAEGGPDYPDTGRMWRLVESHGVSVMGIAPTAVRGLMRYGLEDVRAHDLSSLRVCASTGEPWTGEAWHWFFDNVCGRRAPLLNWTGGTEISGGILCGTVIHPLKPMSFAGPVPGMDADIFDEAGRPVGPGEVGELVLKSPSIGLTRSLWRDDERYIETYWSMFEGVWRHGDWASRDEDGMWYLHGRSDDTIKISGKRTGPAEIEGLAMASGEVSEAAAIGIPDPRSGQAVLLVCIAAPGGAGDEAAAAAVREAVAKGLGKSFRPRHVLFVPDLPRTRNTKIMRRVIRAAVLGQDPGDLTALLNPEAVDAVRAAAADLGPA